MYMKTNMMTLRLLLAVLVAVLLGSSACGGAQRVDEEEEEPEEPLVEEIVGVVPEALRAFNEGIRSLRRSPADYAQALGHFERTLQLDPNFWEAWENIGLIHMDLMRYDEAVRAFEEQMALIDDLVEREWPVEPRPEILLSVGTAHALAGRPARAIEAFERLLGIESDNVEALANLAAVHAETGAHDEARQYARRLLQMSQNDVGALNVLAAIAKQQDDLQLAVYLWDKALDEIAVRTERLGDEGQYADLDEETAMRVRMRNAERLARLNQQLSDIQNELGLVALGQGDVARAERMFRRAVGNNRQNIAARVNLATIYLDYANFDLACAQFAETLALRPRQLAGLIGFAACAYGAGDIDDAYERYELVMQHYPNNAHAASRLGDIAFQDRNDRDAALRWYERNLSIRGLNLQSCNRSTDRVCAAANSIREMQQAQPPAGG